MYMKLHDVATVIAGYTFRGAIKSDNNGDMYVFQAKDLIQGEPLEDVGTLTRIFRDALGYSGYLQHDDVLLIARGMKSGAFRSTVFASDASNVIASSSVHVIRITGSDVLPEYVSHYLNSREGQDNLSQIISGSYIGDLTRSELEKIKIPIPPIQKQEVLLNLYRNMREQQKILNRKSKINQNIINETFKNLTTK